MRLSATTLGGAGSAGQGDVTRRHQGCPWSLAANRHGWEARRYRRRVPTGGIRFVPAALVVAFGFAAVGCGGGSHDRAGGVVAPETVVLTLATHETGTGVREWADAVRRLSHGSLRIVLKGGWRRREEDYEKATIADVRAGKVSLASIPVRAYDTIGVKDFQGLLAPFLIDSYALERRVLASQLPARVLSGVSPLGVRGIALLPGPLKHVLSIGTAMLAPSDYRTQEIAIQRSDVAASTIRALGTTSVELAPGDISPRVRGIETDLVDLLANRYNEITADESLPSNVSFWPRVTSIVINDKAFAGLTGAQRRALEAAGRAALGPSMTRLARDEHQALGVVCQDADQRGALAFLSATPSHLAALRTAVDPVYRRLAQSATTRGVIASVEAMKQGVTAAAAPDCSAGLLHHLRQTRPAGTRRLSANLTATSRSAWDGPVTSRDLGRGRLMLKIRFGFGFNVPSARRATRFEARFAAGTLRGCVGMTFTRGPHGEYRWVGSPGAIKTASRDLRRSAGLSLTFAGVTAAGDHRRLRARLVTDVPTGLPC
jgi:TRAP-type C4-dicarboxylate transport system substrate-binding protein